MHVEIYFQYIILDYNIWYINMYMLIILSEKEVFEKWWLILLILSLQYVNYKRE